MFLFLLFNVRWGFIILIYYLSREYSRPIRAVGRIVSHAMAEVALYLLQRSRFLPRGIISGFMLVIMGARRGLPCPRLLGIMSTTTARAIVSLRLTPIWSTISIVLEVTTRVTSSVSFYESHHASGAVICIILLWVASTSCAAKDDRSLRSFVLIIVIGLNGALHCLYLT